MMFLPRSLNNVSKSMLLFVEYLRREDGLTRGSATPMKMGGTGTRRQRSQEFFQGVTHTKNRKLSGFGQLFS